MAVVVVVVVCGGDWGGCLTTFSDALETPCTPGMPCPAPPHPPSPAHPTRPPLQVHAGSRKQLRQVLALPGLDINPRDACARTPLMLAAGKRQVALVQDILATGRAEVDARDSSGCTAALMAARAGDAAVLRVLVEAGAGACTAWACGPAVHAASLPWPAPRWLRGCGRGSLSRLPLPFWPPPADLGCADSEGTTPVMALAAQGQHRLLAELVRGRQPACLDCQDRRGWAALHHAAAAGHFNAVKVLRSSGADPGLRTADGAQTAHDLACQAGHTLCLPLLQVPAQAEPRQG